MNLSGEDLTDAQHSVLSKGMNFVPKNFYHITKDIIMGVEDAIWKMPIEEANEVRTIVMRSINEKQRICRHNLHKEERLVLKELRNNKKLTI